MGQGRRQFTDEFKSGGGSPAGEQRSAADADCDRVGDRAVDAAQLARSERRAEPGGRDLPPSPRERSAADGARYSKKNCGHLDWRSCAGSAAVFAKRSSPMATRSALRTCDGGSLKNIAVVADGVLAALDALLIVKQRFRPG